MGYEQSMNKKKIEKLNGLKAWWNKNAKPQYKTTLSAEELKAECLAEFEATGAVQMSFQYNKDNRSINFFGK